MDNLISVLVISLLIEVVILFGGVMIFILYSVVRDIVEDINESRQTK